MTRIINGFAPLLVRDALTLRLGIPLLCCPVLLLILIPLECRAAASARAVSGHWWYSATDTDADSVWAGTLGWASTASINWTSGLNQADYLTSAATVTATESKFVVPTVGLPTAKAWIPFADMYNPVFGTGSRATTSGSGSSVVGAVFYGANWSVEADGLLGAPILHPTTGVVGVPPYDARIVGKDPFDIFPGELDSVVEPTFSLYIPLSVMSGESLANSDNLVSEYKFSAEYETMEGIHELLSIHVAGDQATVDIPSSSYSSDVLLFLRSAFDETPSTGLPGLPTSIGAIQALLNADLAGDLTIDTPIHLAVVLNDIAKPSMLLTDGSGALARTSASITAHEAGVPEPAGIALILIGVVPFLVRRIHCPSRLR